MAKKILVTGGAGYVGSTLVPLLLKEGYKVRLLDYLMFGGESLLGSYSHPNFEFVRADIRDKRIVEQTLGGIDAVIHLVALVGEEACKIKPKVTWEINFEATRIIASLCKQKKIKRFIFASTCSNYGIHRAGLARENTSLNITSLYAETKVACEEYLKTIETSQFHPCILRFAMMFGLSPKMRFNLVINDFVREAFCKKRVVIYGPECWRAFTHVRDAADAYLACLKAPLSKISGEIFNVGTENYQKKQLVNLIKKYIPELQIKIIEKKKDPRDYRISFKKIDRILGFKAKRSVEEGLLEIRDAIEKKIFSNPYDPKYVIWYKKEFLKSLLQE